MLGWSKGQRELNPFLFQAKLPPPFWPPTVWVLMGIWEKGTRFQVADITVCYHFSIFTIKNAVQYSSQQAAPLPLPVSLFPMFYTWIEQQGPKRAWKRDSEAKVRWGGTSFPPVILMCTTADLKKKNQTEYQNKWDMRICTKCKETNFLFQIFLNSIFTFGKLPFNHFNIW